MALINLCTDGTCKKFRCATCHAEALRLWRQQHPEKNKEYGDKWRAKNPDYGRHRYMLHQDNAKAQASARHLMERYNLTVDDFNRMVADQNGKCAICLKSTELLWVDHTPGIKPIQVRGLLCPTCNRGLHLIDAGLLPAALTYVKRATSMRH